MAMAALAKPQDDDLTRLRALRESRLFFQANIPELRKKGEFVVLYKSEVIGAGKTAAEAWKAADSVKVEVVDHARLLVHVPQPGESYFF